MAKTNGTYKIYIIIALCVGLTTLISWATTRIESRATDSHIVKDATAAIDKLEKGGCEPAVQAAVNVAIIRVEMSHIKDNIADVKKDVGGLKKDFADYRVEQRRERAVETEKIIKAINDKP